MKLNAFILFKPFVWPSSIRKIIMIINLTTLFMIITLLQVSAEGFSQININKKNTSLESIFQSVESQTDYVFFSKDYDLTKANIDINVKDATVENVLDISFKNLPLTYKIVDKTIVVREAEDKVSTAPKIENVIQQVTIQGQVTDSNGESLPGVSVQLKGSTVGETTDLQGRYSITVPSASGTLVFSYIGFTTQEVAITGNANINVKLLEATTSLGEVVVTALGIQREARTLGYSTVVVDSEAITENRTSTTLGTLQGKVSGVNITSLGTGPQGSTRIRIRGNSSFSGTNTPLIVINGVPVDNSQFGGSGLNNSDGGDGLSSINPDDIESMTVLKGAAAAALYGSRAKDGVVMITTKLKGSGRGFGVDYNMNFTTETPLDFTNFQYEYGQGERGIRPTAPFPTSGVWSFGEKFEPGMTQILFDGIEVPYVPIRDRTRQFYNVGNNLTNTISLSNSGDNGGFNLSFSNTDNKSIVPNSDFNRKTINLGFIQNITNKLSTQGNINYSNEYNRNPAQVGGQEFSTPSSVFTAANSMPFDLLEKYRVDENGNETVWNRFLPRTNPYFSIYEHFENIKRDRIFGNISVKYQFTDWLYIQGRVAQDYYNRKQDYNYPTGYAAIGPAPVGYVNGSYFKNTRQFRERNYDFLIGATHEIGDFGMNLTLGGNQMYRRSDNDSMSAQDFIERGLYTIMNGRVKNADYSLS